MSESTGKHLSDVIDLEKDILPYRMVQIIAGVGAGKNHWVNEVVANQKHQIDENSSRNSNVLLITSRAATANAQAKKLGADRWVDLEKLFDSNEEGGFGFLPNKDYKCIVTNSGIESFIKNRYDENDKNTYIWENFDFIILDEAHSLATDAVFANSPFYVRQFLHHAVNGNPDCHIILMTGTPDPINWLITDELKAHDGFNRIDVFDKCIHVVPKRIIVEPYSSAIFDTIEELKKGKKILYFAKTIGRIKEIYDVLCDDKALRKAGFLSQNIGISFSESQENLDKAKEKYGFSDDVLEKMKELREGLAQNSLLPDEIKILITTSTLKEGIDINNDDIRTVFAESIIPADLTQMAGRLRKGVDDLRVLYQKDFRNYRRLDYQRYTEKCCLEAVNKAYRDYQNAKNDTDPQLTPAMPYLYILCNGLIAREKIIEYMEKAFRYIRYDYFTDKFLWYSGREKGDDFNLQYGEHILRHVKNWFKTDFTFDDTDTLIERSGETFFQSYFPESEVCLWNKAYASQMVKELIKEEGCWNVKISKEQRNELMLKIYDLDVEILEKALDRKDIEKLQNGKIPSQPKSFLKNFWIDLKEAPGKRRGSAYIISDLPHENSGEADVEESDFGDEDENFLVGGTFDTPI